MNAPPPTLPIRTECPPGACVCDRDALLQDPQADARVLLLTREEEKRLLQRLEQITSLLGLPSRNWLGDPATALACVTVVAVWKEAGFFMIFYLAALQTLNPSLKEAAAIEGASRWYFFRRVQWPLLMPTTLFVLVNAVINAFRLVDHLFILTRGGPDNASTLLLYHLYEVGFKFWDTGYAAALTVVLVVALAGVALVQFFVFDKRVHYQ